MEIALWIGLFYLHRTIFVCSKERQSLPPLQIDSSLQAIWAMSNTQLMYVPCHKVSPCWQTYERHVDGRQTFLTHYVAFWAGQHLKTKYVQLVNCTFRQTWGEYITLFGLRCQNILASLDWLVI
jgi:hypothetical protein